MTFSYLQNGDNTIFQQNLAAEIENTLTDGRWYCSRDESGNGNGEQSLLVFNITFDEAKKLCGKYRQPSFVFVINNGKVLNIRLYANVSKNRYSYSEIDERTGLDANDKNADELFPQIAKDFKINITFETLELTSAQMIESINEKKAGLRWSDYAILKCIEKSVNSNITGKYRYYARSALWNNRQVNMVNYNKALRGK